MELADLIRDIADAIADLDSSQVTFRSFQPGAGPYGEPQLVREVARRLNAIPTYGSKVQTKRTPDLLIPDAWALEFKIVRPFGDNAKEAENWSVNLLHPYPGNVSALGDCLKLLRSGLSERKAVVVVGYEHEPPVIDLAPLISAFEILADQVLHVRLRRCVDCEIRRLIHPTHQRLRLFAWEVLSSAS